MEINIENFVLDDNKYTIKNIEIPKLKRDFIKLLFSEEKSNYIYSVPIFNETKQKEETYNRRSFFNILAIINSYYKTKTTYTKLARILYKLNEEIGLYPYFCSGTSKIVFCGRREDSKVEWDHFFICSKDKVGEDGLSFNILEQLRQ